MLHVLEPPKKPTRTAEQPSLKKVLIPPLRVPINPCTREELLRFVVNARREERKILIDNVNMDILWYAQRDTKYQHALRELSSVNLVDGVPVCWLSALAGIRIPERQALTDVVPDLMALAAREEYSVFIVGSNPDTLARAKRKLHATNSMPHTVACWAEPRQKLLNEETNRKVLQQIEQVQPDILFVALGSPFQTHWIQANWESLPKCVIVPVGGAFDYIAGTVGRAPSWMQKTGTEWVFRMLFDRQKRERSLFKRYILTDIPFALHLAFEIRKQRQTLKLQWSES